MPRAKISVYEDYVNGVLVYRSSKTGILIKNFDEKRHEIVGAHVYQEERGNNIQKRMDNIQKERKNEAPEPKIIPVYIDAQGILRSALSNRPIKAFNEKRHQRVQDDGTYQKARQAARDYAKNVRKLIATEKKQGVYQKKERPPSKYDVTLEQIQDYMLRFGEHLDPKDAPDANTTLYMTKLELRKPGLVKHIYNTMERLGAHYIQYDPRKRELHLYDHKSTHLHTFTREDLKQKFRKPRAPRAPKQGPANNPLPLAKLPRFVVANNPPVASSLAGSLKAEYRARPNIKQLKNVPVVNKSFFSARLAQLQARPLPEPPGPKLPPKMKRGRPIIMAFEQ